MTGAIKVTGENPLTKKIFKELPRPFTAYLYFADDGMHHIKSFEKGLHFYFDCHKSFVYEDFIVFEGFVSDDKFQVARVVFEFNPCNL